jgi:hypothetical protein
MEPGLQPDTSTKPLPNIWANQTHQREPVHAGREESDCAKCVLAIHHNQEDVGYAKRGKALWINS